MLRLIPTLSLGLGVFLYSFFVTSILIAGENQSYTLDSHVSLFNFTDGQQNYHFEHDGRGRPGQSDLTLNNRFFLLGLKEELHLTERLFLDVEGGKSLSHAPGDSIERSSHQIAGGGEDEKVSSRTNIQTNVDFYRLEAKLGYESPWEYSSFRGGVRPALGYHYYRYNYKLGSRQQTFDDAGHGGQDETPTYATAGKSRDYNIYSRFPFASLESWLAFDDNWRFSVEGGYTPYVTSRDESHYHIAAFSGGDMNGNYKNGILWFLHPQVEYHWAERWTISMNMLWQDLKIDGEQNGIVARLKSKFVVVGANVGFSL